ncbi:hypothetical protein, partial [Nodularia sp. UHCC 0506]|uniref:hypothetical protein n=1 Tax=Nodularia sp. UHCC 0506 TaxID=3110243 RepID=UPI002B207031
NLTLTIVSIVLLGLGFIFLERISSGGVLNSIFFIVMLIVLTSRIAYSGSSLFKRKDKEKELNENAVRP